MQKTETIDDLATLLQTQVILYTEQQFPTEQFPEVKLLTPASLVDTLKKLSDRQEAKASLEPKNLLRSTAATLATWGMKTTSAIGLNHAPVEYHRLPHLLYFAEKAQEIKKLTKQLQDLATTYSALFDDASRTAVNRTANQLVSELDELFKTTQLLVAQDYKSDITATINNAPRILKGMQGGWGKTELGTQLTAQILDKYQPQFENFTRQINAEALDLIARKQFEKDSTLEVIQQTTYATLQKHLQGPADQHATLEQENRALRQKLATATQVVTPTVGQTQQQLAQQRQVQAAQQQAAILDQQRIAAEQRALQLEQQLQAANEQLIATKITVDNIVEKGDSTHEKFAKVREAFHTLDPEGFCQLHRAILANEKISVEQLLLTSEANHKTQNNYSPLYLAIFDLKTPYKLRDNLNSDIVKLLLENGADPNEKFGHCSYLHATIFQRTTSVKRQYEPRGKKNLNLKLVEHLVMHGASLESLPDDESPCKLHVTPDNIPGIIADKSNTFPIALLLRTCVRYSVKNLAELMQSQEIIHTAFARLQDNTDAIIQRETANLSILFNRYSPIFTLYLNPKDHVNAIETFNKLRQKDLEVDQTSIVKDIQRISKMRDTSKQGAQARGRNAFDDIIGILNELDACIAKVQQMYETRYQCNPNNKSIYILTEFEQGLIVKNLPDAHKSRAAMKHAEAQRALQANTRQIMMHDDERPAPVIMN